MEILRTINILFTPVSLVLSIMLAIYTMRSYNALEKVENRPVATSLVAIGVLFSTFSILTSLIYLVAVFGNPQYGHELSVLRSLLTNVMVIGISCLMIKIYKNRV